jgi:hypothetical protein
VLLFVACVVVLHVLHLIFTSTYASISEYYATGKVPSTDVPNIASLGQNLRVNILYCAIYSLQVFGENNGAWP